MGRLLFTTVHGKSVHRLHFGKNTCDYVQEYFKGATILGITFNCHLLKRLGMGTPAVTIQTKPNAELTSILPTSPKATTSTQMFYPLQEKQEIKGRFLPGTPGAKHPLLAGNRTVIQGKGKLKWLYKQNKCAPMEACRGGQLVLLAERETNVENLAS